MGLRGVGQQGRPAAASRRAPRLSEDDSPWARPRPLQGAGPGGAYLAVSRPIALATAGRQLGGAQRIGGGDPSSSHLCGPCRAFEPPGSWLVPLDPLRATRIAATGWRGAAHWATAAPLLSGSAAPPIAPRPGPGGPLARLLGRGIVPLDPRGGRCRSLRAEGVSRAPRRIRGEIARRRCQPSRLCREGRACRLTGVRGRGAEGGSGSLQR